MGRGWGLSSSGGLIIKSHVSSSWNARLQGDFAFAVSLGKSKLLHRRERACICEPWLARRRVHVGDPADQTRNEGNVRLACRHTFDWHARTLLSKLLVPSRRCAGGERGAAACRSRFRSEFGFAFFLRLLHSFSHMIRFFDPFPQLPPIPHSLAAVGRSSAPR
jgi:hypothetical protein